MRYHHNEIKAATRRLAGNKKSYTKGQLYDEIKKSQGIPPKDQFFPSYHCNNHTHPDRDDVCSCEGTNKGIFKLVGNKGNKFIYQII